MEVDLNEIDENLKQIKPERGDLSQRRNNDAMSAEDDMAIAAAINEIESELQTERRSLFNPEDILELDMNEIDSNLQQLSPTRDDYASRYTRDAATAEDDLAIADAINEVEDELKRKDKSMFNPTTVVMLIIAGGIVTSRIAGMLFPH